MKKILITISVLSLSVVTFADFVGIINTNTIKIKSLANERVEYSDWSDIGEIFDCLNWQPAVNTINVGTAFNQNRDCSQEQEREKKTFVIWSDGSETLKSTELENKIITISEYQDATGTKDYILGQIEGSWTSWVDTGALHTCADWTPNVNTINHGSSFTQNADCRQDQERTRTIYDDWVVQEDTVNRVEAENKTINKNNTQNAIGTKDYIVGTIPSSWSGWSNSGGVINCSIWNPATNTVNAGTRFTQNRSCQQNQTRTRTIYNDWKVGPNTVKTTETGNQTINVNQSQQATGTKPVGGKWKVTKFHPIAPGPNNSCSKSQSVIGTSCPTLNADWCVYEYKGMHDFGWGWIEAGELREMKCLN